MIYLETYIINFVEETDSLSNFLLNKKPAYMYML